MKAPAIPTARLALVVLASLAMAACASHPKPMGPVATNEPPPPPPPPQTYGAPPPGPVEQSGAPIPGSVRDFVINIGDRVYFEFDKYTVRDDARPILDAQASWLNRYPAVRVRIEGNCDELGTREYNFALGARRAESTKNYLIAKGVAPGRMKTISFGKERPVAVCNDISCWSQNRRAVTVLAGAAGS